MPMAFFRFALQSRSPYWNMMAYFHFVHRPLIPKIVSLNFCLEKNASIFLVTFASENLSFLLQFRQLWNVFPSKDTSAKFTRRKTLLVITVFVSMKVLNTKHWDPVLFVSYRERVRKIPHKNEYRRRNKPISDDFPVPQRQLTRIKQRGR